MAALFWTQSWRPIGPAHTSRVRNPVKAVRRSTNVMKVDSDLSSTHFTGHHEIILISRVFKLFIMVYIVDSVLAIRLERNAIYIS